MTIVPAYDAFEPAMPAQSARDDWEASWPAGTADHRVSDDVDAMGPSRCIAHAMALGLAGWVILLAPVAYLLG